MAKISNIIQNSRISIDNTITSKNVQKRFGKPEDNVELFILDGGNNIVYSEENFSEYLAENINEGLFSEFNMDPVALLRNKGFTVGKYRIILNIHRKRIFNNYNKNFKITEISPSRREIRTVGQNIDEERLERLIRTFVRDIENSIIFKDYALNFGNNRISTAINIQINKRGRSLEILFKLFEPLPISVSNNSTFRIIEEITDPISLNVDMGTPEELDDKIIEMLNTDRPVIFDCLVDKQENCFPMIPSGKPHNQMLLGPKDQKEKKITGKGRTLV